MIRALAILLYCYGAVIVPTLHQAFHHPDHIHLGESIVDLPQHHGDEPQAEEQHAAHVEGHDVDHHVDTADAKHDDDHNAHHDSRSPSRDDEHGAGSLWHFGTALIDDSDRVPAVNADRVLVWIGGTPRTERPCAACVRTPRLRGPPSASSFHDQENTMRRHHAEPYGGGLSATFLAIHFPRRGDHPRHRA